MLSALGAPECGCGGSQPTLSAAVAAGGLRARVGWFPRVRSSRWSVLGPARPPAVEVRLVSGPPNLYSQPQSAASTKAGAVTAVRTKPFPSNAIPSGKNSCWNRLRWSSDAEDVPGLIDIGFEAAQVDSAHWQERARVQSALRCLTLGSTTSSPKNGAYWPRHGPSTSRERGSMAASRIPGSGKSSEARGDRWRSRQ